MLLYGRKCDSKIKSQAGSANLNVVREDSGDELWNEEERNAEKLFQDVAEVVVDSEWPLRSKSVARTKATKSVKLLCGEQKRNQS